MSSSISSSLPGLPLVYGAPLPTTLDERNGLFDVLDTPLASSAVAELFAGLAAEAAVAAAAPPAAARVGEPDELYG